MSKSNHEKPAAAMVSEKEALAVKLSLALEIIMMKSFRFSESDILNLVVKSECSCFANYR